MTITPMSLVEPIPVWDDPHSFGWLGQRVFSYGLLLPELHRLRDDEERPRLFARWGEVQIEELRSQLLPQLTDGVTDLTVVSRLGRFRTEIEKAAAAGASVPDGWADELRWFLDHVQRPDQFVWRWRIGNTTSIRVRASHYATLLQRLAIEFDHLVTRQPRLSQCKLCGRVFVPLRPSRPEVHCHANLWRPGRSGPPTLVERCVSLDDETERNRTEKKLYQRYRRAVARSGKSAAESKRALREVSDFKRTHPPVRERGRQPTPEVTYEPDPPGNTESISKRSTKGQVS